MKTLARFRKACKLQITLLEQRIKIENEISFKVWLHDFTRDLFKVRAVVT